MSGLPLRALAVALLVLGACSSSSTDGDAEALGGPGTLVSAEELDGHGFDGTVWFVTYRSESVQGEAVTVTGMVARPEAPAPPGGYPVLSWAHGTTGVADACAPSADGPGTVPGLQDHLDAGYVVAATDYEGLGGAGVHPYLVSVSEGRSVLDAARAAAQVVADVGDDVVVAGHSQGGHAALAAAEIASEWAPELNLLGTVAIAPVADLTTVVTSMFSLPVARGFAVMVAAGWADAYPELERSDVLDGAGRQLAERAGDELCAAEVFAEASRFDRRELVEAQPRDVDSWWDKVQDNSIDPEQIQVPVLVVQGSADVIVRARLTDRFVDALCDAGVEVLYERYDGANHLTVLSESSRDIERWLDDRRAGAPPSTTCG